MSESSSSLAPSLPVVNAHWGLPEALGGLISAFFIAAVGGSALLIAWPSLNKHDTLAFEVVSYQFLTLGVGFAAALLILYRFHTGPRVLGYVFPGWSRLAAPVALAPIVLVGAGLISAAFSTFLPGYHLQGNAQQILVFHNQHPGFIEKVITLLVFAVQAPFTEETLFRGILYQGLRHFLNRWLPYSFAVGGGAVISGVLFGLAHGELRTLPILIFLGIALALIFQYFRSIYASVLVHGIVNALAVISLLHTS